MAKKMSKLDLCWKNCLSMWRWIVKRRKAKSGKTVWQLKSEWCKKHGFAGKLDQDCFFCEYDKNHGDTCASCPARKVEPGFHCNEEYEEGDYPSFCDSPIAFFDNLVAFNKKRLKK